MKIELEILERKQSIRVVVIDDPSKGSLKSDRSLLTPVRRQGFEHGIRRISYFFRDLLDALPGLNGNFPPIA